MQFGLELIDVFESVGNIRAFMQVFWLAVEKIPGNVHMIIDKFAFNCNFLGPRSNHCLAFNITQVTLIASIWSADQIQAWFGLQF